jgi:dienelactone hydrolase
MGINHLYESEYVIDEFGNTHPANITFHDSLKTLEIPGQITADQYREVKGKRQKVLGEDIIYGLNQILNDSFFREHVDKDRIGAFGHSIGGAAAIYASILDDRIKTVLDLDGTPPSLALENGISAPFMFVEDLTDYVNHQGYAKQHARRKNFCSNNKSESWRILIGGANHNSFTDMGYIFGENEQEKGQALEFLKLTSGYMHSFFSHHLNAQEMDLKEMKSDTLEIIHFPK